LFFWYRNVFGERKKKKKEIEKWNKYVI
jgi:hypothetical protein